MPGDEISTIVAGVEVSTTTELASGINEDPVTTAGAVSEGTITSEVLAIEAMLVADNSAGTDIGVDETMAAGEVDDDTPQL